MAFLKKYPILVLTLAVLIAAFVAQAALVFMEFGDLDRARRDYDQAQRQLKTLLNPSGEAALALTQVNVEKIQSAVAEEQNVMKAVVSGLGGQGGAVSSAGMPSNGRDMLFNLQGFVDELRREAQKEADIVNPQSGLTETKPQVDLSPSLYFGFGYYMGDNVPPPADASVPALFQQRQVLEYLVRALYASRPKNQPLTLVSVEREVVTAEAVTPKEDDSSGRRSRRGEKGGSNEVFQINPLISARVEGAITAMAFRLKFIGYTDSLRNFLNTLGKFELPLVVRSVEVQPANKSVANQRKPQAKPAGFDALFGPTAPAGGPAAPGAKPFVPKAPVISENLSEFTVVVEYVSITDPTQKKPAPAKAPAAQ